MCVMVLLIALMVQMKKIVKVRGIIVLYVW